MENGRKDAAGDGPRTKDPSEVIHEPDALEAYLDEYFRSERTTFEQWVMRFAMEPYKSRNRLMVNAVRLRSPRRVFEFACAAGFLAKGILEACPAIETYTISNFSRRMLDVTAQQLSKFKACDVRLIDAEDRGDVMHPSRLSLYDLFVTTSFEHIQHDRELIERFPTGASFVFSVACFDDVEHFRVFTHERQIRNRYEHLLDIVEIRHNAQRSKMVVTSRRR